MFAGQVGQLHEAIPDHPEVPDVARGRFVGQIHAFNPPTEANGLFWTVPLDRSWVTATDSTVTLRAPDIFMWDYGVIGVAMLEGPDGQNSGRIPRTESHLSFDTVWTGQGDEIVDENPEKKFRWRFREAAATVGWSARRSDTTTVVQTSGEHHVIAAQVGYLENGAYF